MAGRLFGVVRLGCGRTLARLAGASRKALGIAHEQRHQEQRCVNGQSAHTCFDFSPAPHLETSELSSVSKLSRIGLWSAKISSEPQGQAW